MKKVLIWIAVILLVPVPFLVLALVLTAPEAPDPDSQAAAWLAPGPYVVESQDMELIDTRRPTNANGDYAGSPQRAMQTTIWFPEDASGPLPLLVYSHGFISDRRGGSYLGEHLASHGYVVAAPNFPLTNGRAPGGPNVGDVVNQPGDVSHVIDAMLGTGGQTRVLDLVIDADRIGVFGLSLGGLTSTLAGYHPEWRDERVKAVVSIAGLGFMLFEPFFANSNAPYMMIGGTMDTVVPYSENAAPVIDRVPGSTLLTVEGGSHVGFSHFSEPYGRFMHNPDSLSCTAIQANVDVDSDDNPFLALGEPSQGIRFSDERPSICAVDPLPESMHPGRQHMITQVGVLAFFEQHLATMAERRARARSVLRALPLDFPEASVSFAPVP